MSCVIFIHRRKAVSLLVHMSLIWIGRLGRSENSEMFYIGFAISVLFYYSPLNVFWTIVSILVVRRVAGS